MKVLFVIPGDINLPTGGYRYNRAIIEQLKLLSIDVQLLNLEGSFPFPTPQDERAVPQQLDDLPPYDLAIIDGLAGGAMPQFIEKLSIKMPVIALIHHPLCLESGLDNKDIKALQTKEHDGLQFASKIITTSEKTSKSVAEIFNQPTHKIAAVVPGVRDIGISTGSNGGEIKLLCVASVINRKNHLGLVSALSKLTALDWHLDCIGLADTDEALFAKLQAQIKETGLEERITFHGALKEGELETAYLNADIFTLPSLYEGYGMVYTEAIMCGLPIIATNAGAIPDTVPKACGILVEPDDEFALTNALETMISNEQMRHEYKQACLEEKGNFPTWPQSAKQFAKILKGVE